MKIQKIAIFCLFLTIFLVGCSHLTKEGKKAITEAAKTSKERSVNFEAIKDKLSATNPNDTTNIEAWKKIHSEGLAAQAKALSDIDTIINGTQTIPSTTQH